MGWQRMLLFGCVATDVECAAPCCNSILPPWPHPLHAGLLCPWAASRLSFLHSHRGRPPPPAGRPAAAPAPHAGKERGAERCLQPGSAWHCCQLCCPFAAHQWEQRQQPSGSATFTVTANVPPHAHTRVCMALHAAAVCDARAAGHPRLHGVPAQRLRRGRAAAGGGGRGALHVQLGPRLPELLQVGRKEGGGRQRGVLRCCGGGLDAMGELHWEILEVNAMQ